MGYFPKWRLKTDGIIGPDERLPASQMAALGGHIRVVLVF